MSWSPWPQNHRLRAHQEHDCQLQRNPEKSAGGAELLHSNIRQWAESLAESIKRLRFFSPSRPSGTIAPWPPPSEYIDDVNYGMIVGIVFKAIWVVQTSILHAHTVDPQQQIAD